MKLYDFQDGEFDRYLAQLIGGTREAQAMQKVRKNVELIPTANITPQQIQIQQDEILSK
ncbi:MAG: hypothetical protein IPO07_08365 [Haliscomenobacter sp.]|nr:hypothetical protein [Haliscomenobacter sp.]MBK9488797.1 hypothetical protein [Haliscomenobacter sp.]